MSSELRVPVARHDELGTIVAADLAKDDDLRSRVADPDVRSGLSCASCGSPVLFVNATLRTRHFRHVADAACVWGPESYWHLAIKDAFVRAFEYWGEQVEDDWHLDIHVELPRPDDRTWQADVACIGTHPSGSTRKMMVEIQQSAQTIDETVRRTRIRQADGWDVLWAHYNPSEPTAPRWLREAAPSVGLDVTPAGSVRVASGYLERVVYRQSEVPDMEPPLPGDDDAIIIDDWDTDPKPLVMFVRQWLESSGLLTDPVDGRRGLAWVTPPKHAPLPDDTPILVDSYEAYTWRQDQLAEEREEATRRHFAELTEARREVEQRLSLAGEAIRPLLDLLQVRRLRPAKYPDTCFGCGLHIGTGQQAAMMKNALTPQKWRLICRSCSTALGWGLDGHTSRGSADPQLHHPTDD